MTIDPHALSRYSTRKTLVIFKFTKRCFNYTKAKKGLDKSSEEKYNTQYGKNYWNNRNSFEMKLCYFMDRWQNDAWSGRRLDYDIWSTHMDIWELSELAIINRAQIDLPSRSNTIVYSSLQDFSEQTSGPYICLEHPKHNPTELLANHTFDEAAWYVMGPVEGWHGKELGTTLGVEQIGTAELHAPFVASVLCYNYFMRK